MQMRQIKANKIRCKKCGDVIESVYRHDMVWCKCGAVAVDGGKDYIRRCFSSMIDDPKEAYDDLTEYVED